LFTVGESDYQEFFRHVVVILLLFTVGESDYQELLDTWLLYCCLL
jgi:hypothetical protein